MTNRPNRWRRRLSGAVAAVAALSVASGALASSHVLYQQDFTDDASGWRVLDGQLGSITHNPKAGTATVMGSTVRDDGFPLGPVSDMGEPQRAWQGDYIAEIDVYLDPTAWEVGQGFDYSVAARDNSLNTTFANFIFHVGVVEGKGLLVNSGEVSRYRTVPEWLTRGDNFYTVTTRGWYTLQHVFRDADGFLEVDLNLLDARGNTEWTASIRPGQDATIDDRVGGPANAWFVYINAPSVDIDNHKLYLVEDLPDAPQTKDDCKKGSFESFGFENQGQCVASVTANNNANK